MNDNEKVIMKPNDNDGLNDNEINDNEESSNEMNGN